MDRTLGRTLLNIIARIISRIVRQQRCDGFLGHVRKIAVIRECCIGDVLQTTPAVRALKAAFPKAELHYYTGRWSRPAILKNPSIDQIKEIPDPNMNADNPLRRLVFFWSKRKERYDLVICFNYGFFHGLESWLMGAKVRIGLDDARGMGCFFNVRIPYSPSQNRQSLYMKMIGSITLVDKNNVHITFYFDEHDIQKASRLLGASQVGSLLIAISPGGAVNPFSSISQRRWFPERFAAVANILSERHGVQIILIGGPSDREVTKKVELQMSKPYVDLAGQMSLQETGALLSVCSVLISNDSALVFLASAVGCPTLVIYGPELSCVASPLGDSHISLEADMPCRPCFPKPRCSEPECMDRISVDMVVQAAEHLLSRKALLQSVVG